MAAADPAPLTARQPTRRCAGSCAERNVLATRSSCCWVHSSPLRRVVERVGNCLVEGERTAFAAACGLVGFSTKGVARVLFAFLLKGNQIGQYGGQSPIRRPSLSAAAVSTTARRCWFFVAAIHARAARHRVGHLFG